MTAVRWPITLRVLHWWFWLLPIVYYIGCVSLPRPPRLLPVSVEYLPYLVKTGRPSLPTAHVLILRPLDNRAPYPIWKGALPATQNDVAIWGIWGAASKEGRVIINSQRLGAQRYMVAGVKQNPDRPRGIYTMTSLLQLVQEGVASHFQEHGFTAHKVSFSTPLSNKDNPVPAQYAVGCEITKFTLVSLERHYEIVIDLPTGTHATLWPVRGPTRAEMSLKVTLYDWPSGNVLREHDITAAVDDPPLKERDFLYTTPGEVASMALSRTVGNILLSQVLQDALSGPQTTATVSQP